MVVVEMLVIFVYCAVNACCDAFYALLHFT